MTGDSCGTGGRLGDGVSGNVLGPIVAELGGVGGAGALGGCGACAKRYSC